MASYTGEGIHFAKPIPLHALRPGSIMAVEAMRRLGAQRRLDVAMAQVVTKVGRPRLVPYEAAPEVRMLRADRTAEIVIVGAPRPIDPVTASALRLQALASAAGFTVQILSTHDTCTVEGYRTEPRREGFRAMWKRGMTAGASWHEPWRYEMVRDERPIGVDTRSHTGKVGYRSPGVGVERLSIAGTPWGIPIGITELTARLRRVGSAA